ncbi:MAG: chromate transporter [Epulopiscium sp.]|nr:chromate transporter [Candidatus Epulonipiscium sp.]
MTEEVSFKKLKEIFFIFLKLGAFTFGGGYAMIPLIEEEVVHKRKWIKEEEVIDVFAVAESIPGAIAINSSTFIGYKIAGRKGAIAANIGVILPSVFIITLIASVFGRFQDNPIIQAALLGVRSCVVALIGVAAFSLSKKALRDKLTVLLWLITVLCILIMDLHPIFMIISGGLIGLLVMKIMPDKVEEIIKGRGDNE